MARKKEPIELVNSEDLEPSKDFLTSERIELYFKLLVAFTLGLIFGLILMNLH